MTFMPPGERIDGTTAECAHLHLLLACFRASPPPMRLPEVTGRPLPDLLATGSIDADVFSTGYDIMAGRYEQLGIRALLPLERVWIGTRSAARPGTARGHGGFHHPAPFAFANARHRRLLAQVRRSGTPRGAYDLIIAAHAAETGRTVLSRDVKARFNDLPGVTASDV
jgi:hypothetical protein